MEETLIIVKPDATGRGLLGKIVARFEEDGFEIVQMCYEVPARELMAEFYAEHEGKEFYEGLLGFMTSGPVCFLRLRREDAIARARELAGPTDSAQAPPGTIRGDFGLDVRKDFAKSITQNSVHASDSANSAQREIALIFPDG